MKKILLILLVLLSTLGFSQNPNWSGYTNDYGSHKFKFYSTRAHYTSLDTVWTPTSQKTGDVWWDNSKKTLSIQTSNTLVRKLITDDSISYYIKQPMATSVDNSLLKTVGTSGRAVEQTGVTIDDANIVSAPTFSATDLTNGYIPYHISDALGQGNSVIYNVAANGRIGIGTTSPDYTIHLKANSPNIQHEINRTTGGLFAIQLQKAVFTNDVSTKTPLIEVGLFGSANIGGTPTLDYYYVGDAYNNNAFRIYANKNAIFYGNVGAPTFSATNLTDGYLPYHISDALGQGNTTMSYNAVNNEIKLTGNQVLTNTTNASKFGIIYKDANPFIHDFNYGNNGIVTTEGGNLFIGENAGNLTMGSNATQTYHSSYNVFTGNSAGRSNTTGYYNVFIGHSAGRLNTTGYGNVFTGYLAGRLNTTGYGNVFTGYLAGRSNTTGYYNVFTGYLAGYANTTGYSNVFTGYSAGQYLADGATANKMSNNSVFIGNETRALTAGNNNQIVIGASATGKGSNTVVLGNTSIVGTYLQGNVGISCNSPTSKLSVLGQSSTNNNLFNFVNGDINKLRTTFADATDSSSVHASSTSTGSPEFHITGKGGATQFKSDSASTTFLGTYAGIYVADASTAQAIATGTTYTKSTAFTTNGSSSNCTADAANDKITITKTGHYLVNCPVSFSGESPNVNWKMAAFLGGVEQPQVHVQRKIGTGGDVGSTTCTGIINVTSVPVDVDIRFKHDQAGNENITVVYSNLTVTYIGE